MNNLPFDLQPIREFIGLWSLQRSSGHYRFVENVETLLSTFQLKKNIVFFNRDLPPPSLIDFSINPIPKFGARTVNIT